MLEVKNLGVRYGSHTALDGVSFRVREGDWLMLCGPNGAGKSTALEAIAQGVAYTGEVLLFARECKQMKPAERAELMGMLSQNNSVPYSFTVEEIARLGRYARGRDDDAVDAALKATEMDGLRFRKINTLSGGEVQRAFLAQLFAQDPAVLMLDEPANHLDVNSQQQIYSLIQRWLRCGRRAVVSVVHDLSAALLYGTSALLLEHGRTVASGSPREVLCERNLKQVYKTDVREYMRSMLEVWSEES